MGWGKVSFVLVLVGWTLGNLNHTDDNWVGVFKLGNPNFYIYRESEFGNLQQDDLNRALYISAGSGNLLLAKAAIANGANVNWRNPDWFNSTPLLHAFEGTKLNPAIVEVLLQAGADPNVASSGSSQRTPLIHASRFQSNPNVSATVTQQLLTAGADVDLVDRSGRTALHGAAWYNLTDTALLLVEAGADLHARDLNGETPIGLARRNNRIQLTELLEALASATPRNVPDFLTIIIIAVLVVSRKSLNFSCF